MKGNSTWLALALCHSSCDESDQFGFEGTAFHPSSAVALSVIHLVRTHERGRGGRRKACSMCARGRGDETSKYVSNSSFLLVYCNVFIYKVPLSYSVVLGYDFHYCFTKHLI